MERGSELRYQEAVIMSRGETGGNIDEFDSQLNDPHQYDNPQDPASLSVVEHLRGLSIYGKLTVLYIFAVLVFLLVRCHWVRHNSWLQVIITVVCPHRLFPFPLVEYGTAMRRVVCDGIRRMVIFFKMFAIPMLCSKLMHLSPLE